MANVFDIFTVKPPIEVAKDITPRVQSVSFKDSDVICHKGGKGQDSTETDSFENKHGGKVPGNDTNEDEQKSIKMDNTPSFVIPKLKRKEEDLLTEISTESHEFQQEILSAIIKSYRCSSSQSRFIFHRVKTVHNVDLTQAYLEKRRELKQAGYSDRDVADSYTFLFVENEAEAEQMCKEGIKIGNLSTSCLGDPLMGVQLSKHADVLRQNSFPVRYKGMFLMFKVIKGHVKAVFENRNPPYLEPTPNHDCHVSKANPVDVNSGTPLQIFESSQVYLYEYGDLTVEDYPRHVLPFAVVSFIYKEEHVRPPKPLEIQPLSPKLPSTFTISSPGGKATVSPMRKKSDEEYTTWSGHLCVKGLFSCRVEMVSTAACIKPVKLGTILNVTKKCSLPLAQEKYFGQLSSLRKSGEVYWRGNYINVCELRPKADSRSQFQKVMNYLGKNNSMAVLKPDSDTVLLLMPDCSLTYHLGLTKPHQYPIVLHCIFLSKQSCKFKSPRYTINQYRFQSPPLGSCSNNTCTAGSAVSPPLPFSSPLHINVNNNNQAHPSSPSLFTPPPSIPQISDPWSSTPQAAHIQSPQTPTTKFLAPFNFCLPPPPPPPPLPPPPPPPPPPEMCPQVYTGSPVTWTAVSPGQIIKSTSQTQLSGDMVAPSPKSPSGGVSAMSALSPLSRSIVAARGESGTAARLGPVSDAKMLYPQHSSVSGQKPFLHRSISTPDMHDPPRPMRVTSLPLGYDEGFVQKVPTHCLINPGHVQEMFDSQHKVQQEMMKSKSRSKHGLSDCEQDSTVTSTCVEDEANLLEARLAEGQSSDYGRVDVASVQRQRSVNLQSHSDVELSEGEVESIVKNYVAVDTQPSNQVQTQIQSPAHQHKPLEEARCDSDGFSMKSPWVEFVTSAEDMRTFLENNLKRSTVTNNKTEKGGMEKISNCNVTAIKVIPKQGKAAEEQTAAVSSTDGLKEVTDQSHLSTADDMKHFLNSTLSKPAKRPSPRKEVKKPVNTKEKLAKIKDERLLRPIFKKNKPYKVKSWIKTKKSSPTIVTVFPTFIRETDVNHLKRTPKRSSSSCSTDIRAPSSAPSSSLPPTTEAVPTLSPNPNSSASSINPPDNKETPKSRDSPVVPTSPGFLALSRRNNDLALKNLSTLFSPPRHISIISDTIRVKIVNTYESASSAPKPGHVEAILYMLHGLSQNVASSALSDSVMAVLHQEEEEEDIRYVKTADNNDKLDDDNSDEESGSSADDLCDSDACFVSDQPVKQKMSATNGPETDVNPDVETTPDVQPISVVLGTSFGAECADSCDSYTSTVHGVTADPSSFNNMQKFDGPISSNANSALETSCSVTRDNDTNPTAEIQHISVITGVVASNDNVDNMPVEIMQIHDDEWFVKDAVEESPDAAHKVHDTESKRRSRSRSRSKSKPQCKTLSNKSNATRFKSSGNYSANVNSEPVPNNNSKSNFKENKSQTNRSKSRDKHRPRLDAHERRSREHQDDKSHFKRSDSEKDTHEKGHNSHSKDKDHDRKKKSHYSKDPGPLRNEEKKKKDTSDGVFKENSRSRHSSKSSVNSKSSSKSDGKSADNLLGRQLKMVSKIADSLSKKDESKHKSRHSSSINMKDGMSRADNRSRDKPKTKKTSTNLTEKVGLKPAKTRSEKIDKKLSQISSIADKVSKVNKPKKDISSKTFGVVRHKSKVQEMFEKKYAENLKNCALPKIPGLYSDQLVELSSMQSQRVSAEATSPSFKHMEKSTQSQSRKHENSAVGNLMSISSDKTHSPLELLENSEVSERSGYGAKPREYQRSNSADKMWGSSFQLNLRPNHHPLEERSETPDAHCPVVKSSSEKISSHTDKSHMSNEVQHISVDKNISPSKGRSGNCNSQDSILQETRCGQPVRNLSSNQITEDRRSRQFHPYKNKRKQKIMASFNIGVRNMDELLADLTTSTLKQKRLEESWSFGLHHNFRQRSRFFNYRFFRNPVPLSPAKSRSNNSFEEKADFTPDNIPEFETRTQQADMLDDLFMGGESQQPEMAAAFEIEKASYNAVEVEINEQRSKLQTEGLNAKQTDQGEDIICLKGKTARSFPSDTSTLSKSHPDRAIDSAQSILPVYEESNKENISVLRKNAVQGISAESEPCDTRESSEVISREQRQTDHQFNDGIGTESKEPTVRNMDDESFGVNPELPSCVQTQVPMTRTSVRPSNSAPQDPRLLRRNLSFQDLTCVTSHSGASDIQIVESRHSPQIITSGSCENIQIMSTDIDQNRHLDTTTAECELSTEKPEVTSDTAESLLVEESMQADESKAHTDHNDTLKSCSCHETQHALSEHHDNLHEIPMDLDDVQNPEITPDYGMTSPNVSTNSSKPALQRQRSYPERTKSVFKRSMSVPEGSGTDPSPSKSFAVFKNMWTCQTGVELSVSAKALKSGHLSPSSTAVGQKGEPYSCESNGEHEHNQPQGNYLQSLENQEEMERRKNEAAEMLEELNSYLEEPKPKIKSISTLSSTSKEIVIDKKLTSFLVCKEQGTFMAAEETPSGLLEDSSSQPCSPDLENAPPFQTTTTDSDLHKRLKTFQNQMSNEEVQTNGSSMKTTDFIVKSSGTEQAPPKAKKRKHHRRPTGPHPDRFNRWDHVVFPFTSDPWRDFKYERNPVLGSYHVLELHDSPSCDPRRNIAILQKRDRELLQQYPKSTTTIVPKPKKSTVINPMLEREIFAPTLAEQITCGAQARRLQLGLTSALRTVYKTAEPSKPQTKHSITSLNKLAKSPQTDPSVGFMSQIQNSGEESKSLREEFCKITSKSRSQSPYVQNDVIVDSLVKLSETCQEYSSKEDEPERHRKQGLQENQEFKDSDMVGHVPHKQRSVCSRNEVNLDQRKSDVSLTDGKKSPGSQTGHLKRKHSISSSEFGKKSQKLETETNHSSTYAPVTTESVQKGQSSEAFCIVQTSGQSELPLQKNQNISSKHKNTGQCEESDSDVPAGHLLLDTNTFQADKPAQKQICDKTTSTSFSDTAGNMPVITDATAVKSRDILPPSGGNKTFSETKANSLSEHDEKPRIVKELSCLNNSTEINSYPSLQSNTFDSTLRSVDNGTLTIHNNEKTQQINYFTNAGDNLTRVRAFDAATACLIKTAENEIAETDGSLMENISVPSNAYITTFTDESNTVNTITDAVLKGLESTSVSVTQRFSALNTEHEISQVKNTKEGTNPFHFDLSALGSKTTSEEMIPSKSVALDSKLKEYCDQVKPLIEDIMSQITVVEDITDSEQEDAIQMDKIVAGSVLMNRHMVNNVVPVSHGSQPTEQEIACRNPGLHWKEEHSFIPIHSAESSTPNTLSCIRTVPVVCPHFQRHSTPYSSLSQKKHSQPAPQETCTKSNASGLLGDHPNLGQTLHQQPSSIHGNRIYFNPHMMHLWPQIQQSYIQKRAGHQLILNTQSASDEDRSDTLPYPVSRLSNSSGLPWSMNASLGVNLSPYQFSLQYPAVITPPTTELTTSPTLISYPSSPLQIAQPVREFTQHPITVEQMAILQQQRVAQLFEERVAALSNIQHTNLTSNSTDLNIHNHTMDSNDPKEKGETLLVEPLQGNDTVYGNPLNEATYHAELPGSECSYQSAHDIELSNDDDLVTSSVEVDVGVPDFRNQLQKHVDSYMRGLHKYSDDVKENKHETKLDLWQELSSTCYDYCDGVSVPERLQSKLQQGEKAVLNQFALVQRQVYESQGSKGGVTEGGVVNVDDDFFLHGKPDQLGAILSFMYRLCRSGWKWQLLIHSSIILQLNKIRELEGELPETDIHKKLTMINAYIKRGIVRQIPTCDCDRYMRSLYSLGICVAKLRQKEFPLLKLSFVLSEKADKKTQVPDGTRHVVYLKPKAFIDQYLAP